MNLEFLVKLLADEGLGTPGRDLFIHRMDEKAPLGIVLRLPIAGIPTDYNLPGYYKAKIQVIVRAQVQADGDAMARNVKRVLTCGVKGVPSRIFNDDQGNFAMQLNQMYLEMLPIVYPRSDGYGIEWSLNFYSSYVIPE